MNEILFSIIPHALNILIARKPDLIRVEMIDVDPFIHSHRALGRLEGQFSFSVVAARSVPL